MASIHLPEAVNPPRPEKPLDRPALFLLLGAEVAAPQLCMTWTVVIQAAAAKTAVSTESEVLPRCPSEMATVVPPAVPLEEPAVPKGPTGRRLIRGRGRTCTDLTGGRTCTDLTGGRTCTDLTGGRTCTDLTAAAVAVLGTWATEVPVVMTGGTTTRGPPAAVEAFAAATEMRNTTEACRRRLHVARGWIHGQLYPPPRTMHARNAGGQAGGCASTVFRTLSRSSRGEVRMIA